MAITCRTIALLYIHIGVHSPPHCFGIKPKKHYYIKLRLFGYYFANEALKIIDSIFEPNLYNVPNLAYLSECGRQPLSAINDRLYIDESSRVTWTTYIKQLVFQIGFGYALIANKVCNTIAFTYLLRKRVVDCALNTLNKMVLHVEQDVKMCKYHS